MLKMKNMGTVLDIQYFAEDILLISKTLNFLHCESLQWGNTVLKYFRQIDMGQKSNLIFYIIGWVLCIIICAHCTTKFSSTPSNLKLTWDFYMDSVCHNMNWALLPSFTWKQSFLGPWYQTVSWWVSEKQHSLWSAKKYSWRM